MPMKMTLLATAATGLLAIAAPAHATTTINLGGSAGSGSSGNSIVFTGGGTTVTASGWSIDNAGNVHEGALGQWSNGLGVINGRTDNSHTVDNVGWTDFVLFQFDSVVSLDSASFSTGWDLLFDSDATIGFANLGGAFTGNLAGFSFGNSPGSLFGSGTRPINVLGGTGNTWIIGAAGGHTDIFPDGFKIGTIGFSPVSGAVPEPSTWAFMLLGFGFAGAAMRRRKGQQVRTNAAISFA
ncbi:PEPxxWA-CTERM sorting domain-containing protein [Qipengyuania sp.]|uniref:PEPxxWA-CTERM sorting domain-containing protein n=1 Tax=Qipengyuania sp. TaxID=2004515 RepID=UPI003736432C